MEDFTARNAVLSGALLIRRRPLLVLSWAALLLGSAVLFAGLYQLQRWMILAAFEAHRSPAAVTGPSLALTLLQTLVSVFVAAVVWASAFRAFLRPDAPASPRLGRLELLVAVSWLITQLLSTLPVLAYQGTLAFAHGVEGWLAINRWLITVVEVVGLFWSAVAAVWAFDRAQIAPFRCWTIARGRFWKLAGLFIAVAALGIVAKALIRQEAVVLNHHVVFGRATLQSLLSPPMLLDMVGAIAIETLRLTFLAAIVASAYRTRPQESQPAPAFSPAVGGPA